MTTAVKALAAARAIIPAAPGTYLLIAYSVDGAPFIEREPIIAWVVDSDPIIQPLPITSNATGYWEREVQNTLYFAIAAPDGLITDPLAMYFGCPAERYRHPTVANAYFDFDTFAEAMRVRNMVYLRDKATVAAKKEPAA
jgi:hypothetical protein